MLEDKNAEPDSADPGSADPDSVDTGSVDRDSVDRDSLERVSADRLVALERRVAELEGERDRLQAELDAIANRATDRWLSAAQFESKAVLAMQSTVSWKVTRPLRAVRSLQFSRGRG